MDLFVMVAAVLWFYCPLSTGNILVFNFQKIAGRDKDMVLWSLQGQKLQQLSTQSHAQQMEHNWIEESISVEKSGL